MVTVLVPPLLDPGWEARGEVICVVLVARDEVTEEATVPPAEDVDVVDVRDDSDEVREIGEMLRSSLVGGVNVSREDLEEMDDRMVGRGSNALTNALGSSIMPVDVLVVRGEL